MNVTTKYNWENVPKDITHLAQDKNGFIFGYRAKPIINEDIHQWQSPYGGILIRYMKKKGNFDWRDSLEQRPEISEN